MSEKRKVGRPKRMVSSLWDGWQDDILSLYNEGASDVEIKALIWNKTGSFSNGLWDRWIEESEEFSQTIKNGKLLAQSWWANKGRTNLGNKEFSFTGWYMNMKNRYGWADKQETKHSGEVGAQVLISLPDNDRDE